MPKGMGYGGKKNPRGSNTGKKMGDSGVKAKGNKRTRQVGDRYK